MTVDTDKVHPITEFMSFFAFEKWKFLQQVIYDKICLFSIHKQRGYSQCTGHKIH